ncbi:MAG: hypothetical protein JJE51_05450 [Thermoanaerobaculia bacterium]|nr:hypothetical protein [Thermoanaerobaculia bacterium]
MRLQGEERREFQRLRLDPTIPGALGATPVTILEIGVLGARVRHDQPLAEYETLTFRDGEAQLEMRCERARAITGSETGLRFLASIGESGDNLRLMLARLVTHEFEVRRQLPKDSIPLTVDGDKTIRGKDAAFLCYRLDAGVWRKRHVFLPEQPASGFTVARASDSDELRRLCRVYEASDDEGRRLIRLFAELSVSDVLEIPPRM